MKGYFHSLQIGLRFRQRCWLGLLLISFFFSVWIAQAIPPMQSPDENSHLIRAYAISQGKWFLTTSPDYGSGSLVDQNFLEFMDAYLRKLKTLEGRPSEQEQATLNSLQWNGQNTFFPSPGTGYYNPLIYCTQASGLWLGQKLNWTIIHTYQLCRFLSTLVVFALIGLAFKIYEPNLLTIGLLILPMSLFQILMPTIDGLCHALTLISLSWFMHLKYRPENRWANTAFAALLILLITCRIYALPLLLLLLLTPSSQRRPSKYQWLLFALSMLAVGGWSLWALSHTIDLRIFRTLNTTQILQYYLLHPGSWITVLSNTLGNLEILTWYVKSFIGVLGWLHLPLPDWYYFWCSLFLLILGFASTDHCTSNLRNLFFDHFVFFLMALFSTALVLNLLLLTWTPFPSNIIEGVQGRYFWIPACIFACGLGPTKPRYIWPKALLGLALACNLTMIVFIYHGSFF